MNEMQCVVQKGPSWEVKAVCGEGEMMAGEKKAAGGGGHSRLDSRS